MFLTKKTAPSTKPKQKMSKALGGWDDDEPGQIGDGVSKVNGKQNHFQIQKNQVKVGGGSGYDNVDLLSGELGSGFTKPKDFSLKGEDAEIKSKVQQAQKANETHTLYTASQLASMPNIECESKLVNQILSPGGIRVKQADSMLHQFYEQAKSMNIPIIGSLLISSLSDQNGGFQTKAKSLYAIEYLCKKSVQYSVYFKLHAEVIRDSPGSDQHGDSYGKIKKGLLATLGALVVRPEERKLIDEELESKEGINFIDPGYNNALQDEGVKGFITMNKKNSQKAEKQKPNKKLISPMELKNKQKKPLQGPKSKKVEAQDFNLLGDSEVPVKKQQIKPQTTSKQVPEVNLLDLEENKKASQDLLSFF